MGCGVNLQDMNLSRSSRITAFTGRFGSGKTEIALNYALWLVDQGEYPFLIDLDTVTPYFRVRDRVQEMSGDGVEVVTPFAVGQYLDIPAIDPRILGTLEQTARPVVLDVGGDRQGARVLAQYASLLGQSGGEMLFVINPYRPFMSTRNEIETAIEEIEASTKLSASALVSNPNLVSESTTALFREGHALVDETSQRLDLPIAFAVMSEALARQMGDHCLSVPILIIHRFFSMFDAS